MREHSLLRIAELPIATLPIAYISDCDAAWKKFCRKLQVMLPIAYCLLLIVMEHGRRFVGNGK